MCYGGLLQKRDDQEIPLQSKRRLKDRDQLGYIDSLFLLVRHVSAVCAQEESLWVGHQSVEMPVKPGRHFSLKREKFS